MKINIDIKAAFKLQVNQIPIRLLPKSWTRTASPNSFFFLANVQDRSGPVAQEKKKQSTNNQMIF